jgi:hypothetical protein
MNLKKLVSRFNSLATAVGETEGDRWKTGLSWMTTGERRRAFAGLLFKVCGRRPTAEDVGTFVSEGHLGALLGDVEFWARWRGWAVARSDADRVVLFSASLAGAVDFHARRERERRYFFDQGLAAYGPEAAGRLRAGDEEDQLKEQARMETARRWLPIPLPAGGGGGPDLTSEQPAALEAS